MGASGKRKGAAGERQACALLGTMLSGRTTVGPNGAPVAYLEHLQRNLDQVRSGGSDIMGIDGLCIEVKRCETLTVGTWWQQVNRAADEAQRLPVLMYRQNRRAWQFCLPAMLLLPSLDGYITLGEREFAVWLNHWVTP